MSCEDIQNFVDTFVQACQNLLCCVKSFRSTLGCKFNDISRIVYSRNCICSKVCCDLCESCRIFSVCVYCCVFFL